MHQIDMYRIANVRVLEGIKQEYGLQPEILKREMNHSEITRYNYKELRHFWNHIFSQKVYVQPLFLPSML